MTRSFLPTFVCTIMCFSLLPLGLAQHAIPPAPAAPKHPVTDEYQGMQVVDDYRWLEDWDNPEVKEWSHAENQRTRDYLDHLASRPAIKERFEKLMTASSSRYFGLTYRGGTLFAMKAQPPKQQPMLVALRSADDPASEKVIIDPNALSDKGSIAIDFYVPSLDGKLVAISLSENGSEDGAAHVFETATGKELSDRVPRVNFGTAGGSFAWNADGSGFYYTRYPQGTERPAADANFYQQVYFHKLGTESSADTYVIGKDFPRIGEIQLHTSDDGKWILLAVSNGDGGEYAHYVMDSSGKWSQVTRFEDQIVEAALGAPGDPALYFVVTPSGSARKNSAAAAG
jgi:Protease II